jgi:hypothetical protein
LPGQWERLAALLEAYADADEKIGFPALSDRAATVARDHAKAAHQRGGSRDRLYLAGSRSWQLAVFAGCADAMDHIHDLESGAQARLRRDASVQTRDALGREWIAFVADCMAEDIRHDPS